MFSWQSASFGSVTVVVTIVEEIFVVEVVVDSGRGMSRWVVGLVVHPALLSVSLNEPATITLKIIFGYETEREATIFS